MALSLLYITATLIKETPLKQKKIFNLISISRSEAELQVKRQLKLEQLYRRKNQIRSESDKFNTSYWSLHPETPPTKPDSTILTVMNEHH